MINDISVVGTTLGAIVALATLIVGVSTYVRQNSAKRFEIFQGLNTRFDATKFTILENYLIRVILL